MTERNIFLSFILYNLYHLSTFIIAVIQNIYIDIDMQKSMVKYLYIMVSFICSFMLIYIKHFNSKVFLLQYEMCYSH